METDKINHSELTASKRHNLSMPFRYLRNQKLLQGRILDFGCGYGKEADRLKKAGYDITGYDKFYRPELPEGKFDTIVCIYVLDVLQPEEQKEVLSEVFRLLRTNGNAYFAVRRDIVKDEFFKANNTDQYTYRSIVKLPYSSIRSNEYYEIYHYQHIAEEKQPAEQCVFCNLSNDIEKICESDTCISFYDANPVSQGHALIIPKRHVASYFDLTEDELKDMNRLLIMTKEIIDERYHPDGYNVGVNINEAAGQSVFHVHMHVIPRYTGDVEHPKGGIRAVIPGKQSYGDIEHITAAKHKKSPSHIKAYTIDQKREEHGNAYLPWDDEADALLIKMYVNEGKSIAILSEIFERTRGAIRSRLIKLGAIKDKDYE